MNSLDQAGPMTRRSLLATLLMATGLLGYGTSKSRSADFQRRPARDALKRVVNWGCQYQNIDLNAIAASNLDMIVVDLSLNDSELRFVTPAECERLKVKPDGSPRLVLAY